MPKRLSMYFPSTALLTEPEQASMPAMVISIVSQTQTWDWRVDLRRHRRGR